jgi:indole-3-glycerol phosphate synthase
MNRLQKILEVKKTEVARILPRLNHLRAAALERNDFRGFASAIDVGPDGLGLIAEVKKASPSAGVIAAEFDPVAIAQALSVLTDEQFFQGHLSYLTQIRKAVSLPCLRKDFIIHDVQIFEAAVAGADAVLLIVAALEQEQLAALYRTAELCQLDVLVEVHTLEELDRALDIGARVIGINNRNLTTFEVDLGATEQISEEVPEGVRCRLQRHSGGRNVDAHGGCFRPGGRAAGGELSPNSEVSERDHFHAEPRRTRRVF